MILDSLSRFEFWFKSLIFYLISSHLSLTFCAFLLSARWFWWYILLKLETMTGTGRAMTRTPLREQTPPTTFPAMVFGTMSPYLLPENKGKRNKQEINKHDCYYMTMANINWFSFGLLLHFYFTTIMSTYSRYFDETNMSIINSNTETGILIQITISHPITNAKN